MKLLGDLKTRTKLIGGFVIVAILVVVVAVFGIINVNKINTQMDVMYSDNLIPISQIGTINTAFTNIRGDIYRYLVVEDVRAETLAKINERLASIQKTMDEFTNQKLSADESTIVAEYISTMEEFNNALDEYILYVDQGNTDAALVSLNTGGKILLSRQNVSVVLDKLTALNIQLADDKKAEAEQNFKNTLLIMIITTTVGMLLAITLGLLISNSITKPLSIIKTASIDLSKGILLRDMSKKDQESVINRKDEIGDIGKAFASLIQYMQEMGKAADFISKNDLTTTVIKVNPKLQFSGQSFG